MTGKDDHTEASNHAERGGAVGAHGHGQPHGQQHGQPHGRSHDPEHDPEHDPKLAPKHDSKHDSKFGLRAKSVLTAGRRQWSAFRRGTIRFARRPAVRRMFWGSAVALAIVMVAIAGLWWRLAQGPIEIDLATPWLKAAIEDNFGGSHTVTVGGTQLERDEDGRTSLRLRDIVVRDGDGTVVASAPKAEVGISGIGLLRGEMRARSLNLVGAEMAVRIETDGRVTVFAGADKRPIATAAPAPVPTQDKKQAEAAVPPVPVRSELESFSGALAWIDGLGASGLDGHDLHELGLKSGSLTVDDRRNGKRWTFDRINASLRRPAQGGVVFRLESENPQRPWLLSAAMRPLGNGVRAVGIEARSVSTRDILLAMRAKDGEVDADLPLSASIRAEIAADGTPNTVQGQLLVGPGVVIDNAGASVIKFDIDRADFRFNWDARRRSIMVPFQVQSGGNQFTLRADVEAPTDDSGVWKFTVVRGDPVIDPIILAPAEPTGGEGLALNRIHLRGRLDTVRRRFDLDQGDMSRIDTRPLYNIGVAVSGSVDYSTDDPRLAFGVAGTRMTMAAMKRLWPTNVATHVRAWVDEHISGGVVERVLVAGNAPLSTFKTDGPPTPDDGLSVDIETSGTMLQPVPDLPPIRDADLTVRVTGRTATINLGRGTVEVTPGRKLNIANGQFEVPDTHPKPAPARAHFRIDGSVPAAAALLASEALRENVGIVLDPATSRGTIAARVTLNLPLAKVLPKGAVSYAVEADLSGFSAEKMLVGQKLEASSLQVTASTAGYQIKGNVKIDGTAAAIHLTKEKNKELADLQLQATLDEAGRRRLGIDLGGGVTGAIPVKITGKVGGDAKEERLILEADLSPVKIDDLLPGWTKPAGKSARLTATLIKSAKSARFEDLVINGSGVTVKGAVEVDDGELVSANFPVFSLSDGDKISVKANRRSDGVMHVVMRGDVYDGRSFVKASVAGHDADKGKRKQRDLDLDVKIGTVAGHNGETLRALDLKLVRRGGRIRTFNLSAKIGRDAALIGDLRLRARDNHQVVYLETADAGALFRFTDMYPRMFGGRMWVAMDPPSDSATPQVGHLFISNFAVRGEPALDRVVSSAARQGGRVAFSELRTDFTRVSGRMSVRDGVVRGPLVGATIEGNIDYVRDDVHLRGTFVPLYGLNNMFGQIPIVGLFLGGSNEGLLGITYEAVGPPSAPRISVNPISAIAPGLLRKFIPSPGALDPNFIPPSR